MKFEFFIEVYNSIQVTENEVCTFYSYFTGTHQIIPLHNNLWEKIVERYVLLMLRYFKYNEIIHHCDGIQHVFSEIQNK